MTNIFAYTQTGYQHTYPGYVSVNDREGLLELSVRAPGKAEAGSMTLTKDQARTLLEKLEKWLG